MLITDDFEEKLDRLVERYEEHYVPHSFDENFANKVIEYIIDNKVDYRDVRKQGIYYHYPAGSHNYAIDVESKLRELKIPYDSIKISVIKKTGERKLVVKFPLSLGTGKSVEKRRLENERS